MGLIDSTNRIERAILSDKQERKREREELKRVREEARQDKLEVQLAKKEAQQQLNNTFCFIFSKNGTKVLQALQTLEMRTKILKYIARQCGTLAGELAEPMYSTELQKVYKIYLADEKARGIKYKTPEEKIIDKINIVKTIWHSLKVAVYGSLLLIFSPVILARLISGDPSKPKRRRSH